MTIASATHRSRPCRFGLTTITPRAGDEWRTFLQAVENSGLDCLTFPDHLVPSMSPFASAASVAAAGSRLTTGTLVLNNDLRHPVQTAREAATLSMLSGGRFELGLGAGHMKKEYDAAGLTFDPPATRVARLVESAEIIRALLDGRDVDVDGSHYQVHAQAGALVSVPKQRVPLLIGGNGTQVLTLAGRLADIAGLVGFSHNRTATAVSPTHFGPDGLADRIAVVRAAAGERFEEIELNVLIQEVVATDDRDAAAARLAPIFKATPSEVLDSPFVLIGTHEQMAEAVRDRQHRFGVSYFTVFDEFGPRRSAMPDIAEVIALLRS